MGRGASRLKPKRPNGDYQASSPIHPSQKKTVPLTDPVLGDTCITCIAKMSSKNKNWRLYLVIFGYIYRNLVQLRLILAPIFGLGGSCAFLVFFSGEVSDNGKPVPPPSRCLAAGRAIVAVKPRPCRSHPCHFSKISAIARLDRLRGEIGTID